MEFNGRIVRLLPMTSGVSAKTGEPWKAQPFIFEYFERDSDRYPDRVVLDAFGDDDIAKLKEGREVRCSFYHAVYEKDGRAFNRIRLHKISASIPTDEGGETGTNVSGGGLTF